ncbi:hypothetical protein LTR78_009697 [Recurvomyces mirabilis]|uniref:NACHT domain-containing protein n=1 Tax=Recurvomyces mirabilis TaxID=574656 RepID=A0AAE0TTB9_9PEZI|nr:hypothetical protein LTR78_009697 [Recurvomyces mirabilis]KAK5150261.1 hypothetical protein LTS14_010237 [Recurvomyces mirabilis]
MDVLGTAVGVASFGIQICQGLLTYYGSWKDYHQDVKTAYDGINDLSKTFQLLKQSLAKPSLDTERSTKVEECLSSCTTGLGRLEKKLKKLQSSSQPVGLRSKAWAEVQRAWYPLRASTLVKLQEIVGDLRQHLSLALQVLQLDLSAASHQKLVDVDTRVGDVATQVSILQVDVQAWQDRDNFEKLVNWLSPPDPSLNHNAARNKHEQDTGRWLLESGEYKQWKTSRANLLWLYGKAGCGKTVLCSTVIEDLRAYCGQTPSIAIASFYFSFADKQKQSYTALLSSLIIQLCHSQVPYERLQQLYDGIYPEKPSQTLLYELLLLCLQQYDNTYLVLDALDETPEDDEDRSAVLAWLGCIVRAVPILKIFMTSRQVHDIEVTADALHAIPLSITAALANADIITYVQAELSRHPRLRQMDAKLKAKVLETFEQKADGMFRWAFCQLEELKRLKGMRPRWTEKALECLPKSLDETYERMLVRINEIYQPEALRALRWLSFQMRPLTLGELCEACLIDPEAGGRVDLDNRGPLEDILEILGSLVHVEEANEIVEDTVSTIDESAATDGTTITQPTTSVNNWAASTVRLAHFSVKEYLSSTRISDGPAAGYAMQASRDQPNIANSCLAYLLHYSSSHEKQSALPDLETFPLLQYSASWWAAHMTWLGLEQPEPPTLGQDSLQYRLLGSDDYRRDWQMVYDPDESEWNKGEKDMAKPFGSKEKSCPSALYYASSLGLEATVKEFLQNGADVNEVGGYYSTALHAAVYLGHKDIVQILIDAGADLEFRTDRAYPKSIPDTSSGLIAKFLNVVLETSADVNVYGRRWGTPLQYAAKKGHREIVMMLLKAGANVNAEGEPRSALQDVARAGDLETARLLVKAGADLEMDIDGHGTPLQLASWFGNPGIVQFLIEAGANVKAKGCHKSHGTAVHAASSRGFTDIVEMLVKAGADESQADEEEEADSTPQCASQ